MSLEDSLTAAADFDLHQHFDDGFGDAPIPSTLHIDTEEDLARFYAEHGIDLSSFLDSPHE